MREEAKRFWLKLGESAAIGAIAGGMAMVAGESSPGAIMITSQVVVIDLLGRVRASEQPQLDLEVGMRSRRREGKRPRRRRERWELRIKI